MSNSMFIQHFMGEDSLSSEGSGSKPTCCQRSFSAVLSQANSWKYRKVLRNSCVKCNNWLKHRHSKIILTLISGKICISSPLSWVFSPVPAIHVIVGGKKTLLTCGSYCKTGLWFSIFQIAHCANNPKWESFWIIKIINYYKNSHSSPLTHQQLTSDITSIGN